MVKNTKQVSVHQYQTSSKRTELPLNIKKKNQTVMPTVTQDKIATDDHKKNISTKIHEHVWLSKMYLGQNIICIIKKEWSLDSPWHFVDLFVDSIIEDLHAY